MKSILEELFYGNVCPNTDCRSRDKEVKDLMAHIADHHRNLNETLTDKQKELFEKFDNAWDELNDINEREIFVYCSPFLWEHNRIYVSSRKVSSINLPPSLKAYTNIAFSARLMYSLQLLSTVA